MTEVEDIVSRIEGLGGCLALERDGSLRYRIPRDNPESRQLLDAVKAEKEALIAYLRARAAIPMMSRGVSLVEWKLREPPIAIETCAVVIDPALSQEAIWSNCGLRLPSRNDG